jgi:hypothetical protein
MTTGLPEGRDTPAGRGRCCGQAQPVRRASVAGGHAAWVRAAGEASAVTGGQGSEPGPLLLKIVDLH